MAEPTMPDVIRMLQQMSEVLQKAIHVNDALSTEIAELKAREPLNVAIQSMVLWSMARHGNVDREAVAADLERFAIAAAGKGHPEIQRALLSLAQSAKGDSPGF